MGDDLRILPADATHRSATEKKSREQVAAICFRILSTGVEFLLVRTRRGRWTFPKGGAQPELTHAQSAALEAFEEAGVHGRIEEIAFLRYELKKIPREGDQDRTRVQAHLCEVLRLDSPQEAGREPTWFPSRKAKRRLAEGRSSENAIELARVVDRAMARIRRLPSRSFIAQDSLFAVKFESSEINLQRFIAQTGAIQPVPGGAPAELASRRIRGRVLSMEAAQPK